jgi:hypothetical protein
MRFKPSAIIHDLRDLKGKFQHVDEGTIKEKYVRIFRNLAKDASCKSFLQLLAKRGTREELEREYPAPKLVFEKVIEGAPVPTENKKTIRARIGVFFGKLGDSGGLATD